MRPTDKDIEAFDLDELFQQYETDIFQRVNGAAEDPSGSDDLAHLFEVPSSNEIDPFSTLPMPNWDPSSDDAWQRALQLLEDNPASPAQDKYSSVYPESGGKASLSDPGLYHPAHYFELDHSERRPSSSAPSTPKPSATRPNKKVYSTPDQTHRQRIQKPAGRKTSPLTKMMAPSTLRAGIQDPWASRMDTASDEFALKLSASDDPRTRPPSSKVSQEPSTNGLFPRAQPCTVALSPPSVEASPETQHSNYQLTPLSSPAIDTNSRGRTSTDLFIFGTNVGGTMNLHPHAHNAALSALHTPPPSTDLPMTTWVPNTTPTLDFALSASPDFHSMTSMSGTWWNNGMTATTTQAPTPTYNGHRRAYSQGQGMSFSSGGGVGLGISCDTASFSCYGGGMGSSNTPMSNSLGASATRRAHKSSIRKSSHSSAPHSASHKSAQDCFVNFTPDDSKKILTGVAPSGSSKTKARREKEAADKRRKLSQAAMKAVIEAWGDISRLEEGGLLSLEVE
ncbi:uncharacterized protein EI97DRAFT_379180 [Westerdykella ornata]|uniref:Uncharacterized protein n=1 Tax=Westerdykella ornata TaxID=318751 RepID=A0A6A6JG22_WESOR|nr:uncharacterized protein EI97DRAFT_379180 [Westerdykella ornata]KAF2275362.1 hypothetical protein EI97DRAFT_379180 [Westerdykella ornata]